MTAVGYNLAYQAKGWVFPCSQGTCVIAMSDQDYRFVTQAHELAEFLDKGVVKGLWGLIRGFLPFHQASAAKAAVLLLLIKQHFWFRLIMFTGSG